MDHAEVEAEAEALIGLMLECFRLPSGVLARTHPSDGRTLFDNLDDVVPFFVYFGRAHDLVTQVRALRDAGGSMETVCARDGILDARRLDEWLGGLYCLWKATRDDACRALLEESVAFIEAHLLRDGYLHGALRLRDLKAAPYYEPWSAGLLEVFAEMWRDFPSPFNQAQQVLRSWLADDYFQRHGLFPYRAFRSPAVRFAHRRFLSRLPHLPDSDHPGEGAGPLALLRTAARRARFALTPAWYSKLMKSNSTAAFTLLEFHIATGDAQWRKALERWCDSALAAFCEGGRVHMEYNPVTARRAGAGATAAFILADTLCDAAACIPGLERHLPRVKEILDHQWLQRLPSGLVPLGENGRLCHLDNQVDVSIALRRYSELSGEREYLERSRALLETALRAHQTPHGYRTYSGEGAEDVIDPKYNALVLKGLIHLLTLEEPLYPDLRNLFKDR